MLDAVGSESAALLGVTYAGAGAILTAATHPERVHALILINSFARLARERRLSGRCSGAVLEQLTAATRPGADNTADGTAGPELMLMAPSLAGRAGFPRWWVDTARRGASPTAARSPWKRRSISMSGAVVGGAGTDARAPPRETDSCVPVTVAISRITFRTPSTSRSQVPITCPWANGAAFVGEIEEFLTGARRADLSQRVLATVLFTDIVGSTRRVVEVGDQEWRSILDQHDRLSQREIVRFGGRLIETTGDGVLATFDVPGRAIHAGSAMRDAMHQIGVQIRAGLHVGEIELRGDDVAGVAVHVAARVPHCGGSRRDPRLRDDQGAGRGFGSRVRRPGRPRSQRDSRSVAPVCNSG